MNSSTSGWLVLTRKSLAGSHPQNDTMITEAEYDRVQALLGRNGNTRPQSDREFPFTGLIRCGECNRMVTAEEKHQLMCGNCRFKFAYRQRKECPRCETSIESMRNPTFLHYTYYHCSNTNRSVCRHKSVSDSELEIQIADHLARIQISAQFKDYAIKYLRELHAMESKDRNAIVESQQKEYQVVLKAIDNLIKLKTSPENSDGGLLSDVEYGQRRMELMKEKASLMELLQDTGHRVDQHLKLTERAFEFACTARERFANADPKTKKLMIMTFGSNLTLKDKQLLIEARKPFFMIEKSQSPGVMGKEAIEPKNTGHLHGWNGANDRDCPDGLREQDVDRTLYHRNEILIKGIYHFFRSFKNAPQDFFPDWNYDDLDKN